MVELVAFDVEVKKFGNGAHVVLPKSLAGEKVDVIRRGQVPQYAVEFRSPKDDPEEPPKHALLADVVTPQIGDQEHEYGIIIRGSYGPKRDEVNAFLRKLEKAKRKDRLDMLVLKDGHTPVARVRGVEVTKDSVRKWSYGFTFTVAADPTEILEPESMGPAVQETAWRRQLQV
jgi:hypothetical protein